MSSLSSWFRSGPLAALALLATTGLAPEAHAAPTGRVVGLAVEEGGSLRRTDSAPGAMYVRGGMSTPLRPGVVLEDDDQLVTSNARVLIEIPGGGRVLVHENTEISMQVRNFEQLRGGAFYDVGAPFTVQVGKVLVTVDGTRFLVTGHETVTVASAGGDVKVTSREEPVVVGTGEMVETRENNVPGGVRPITYSARREAWQRTWLLGAPSKQVSLLAGGGIIGGGAGITSRVELGLLLAPSLRATAQVGVGALGSVDGVRIPASLGLAWELGMVSLGGELLSGFEASHNECGSDFMAMHLGGAGAARLGVPMGRSLSLVTALRGGYIGQPLADLSIGMSWGF